MKALIESVRKHLAKTLVPIDPETTIALAIAAYLRARPHTGLEVLKRFIAAIEAGLAAVGAEFGDDAKGMAKP